MSDENTQAFDEAVDGPTDAAAEITAGAADGAGGVLVQPLTAPPDADAGPAADGLVDAAALLDTGGPVVVLLLVMSVIALTLVLVKLVQWTTSRRSATALRVST